MSDGQSDQSDSSAEAQPVPFFYLYQREEYLEERCDYATGWSGSTLIIKEDISGEKNRTVDTRRIGKGILRKEAQFKDEVMKY